MRATYHESTKGVDDMRRLEGVSRGSLIGWLLLALSIVATPIAADAAGVDVTGTWNLTANDPGDGCRWTGLMFLTQTGMDFTGSASLNLVAGGGQCLAVVSGTIQGSISGSGSGFFIDFGLASGPFGSASFDGTVTEDGQSATGEFTNNASGTWSAQKQPPHPAPTLSGIALATLFGLLTVAGVVCVRRRVV